METQLVEAIEKSLLTGQWIDPGSGHETLPHIDVIKSVVEGSFSHALKSPTAGRVFALRPIKTSDIVDGPISSWLDLPEAQDIETEVLRLGYAVACLHAFLQANWTGPDLQVQYADFLPFSPETAEAATEELLDRKAVSELSYGGEPAYHLARGPLFLRFAQILLALPYSRCSTAPWWSLRTWLVHQQVLDEPVAVPDSVFSSLHPLIPAVSSDRDLLGQLHLEQGLLEHRLSNNKSAADYFARAARATGLEYELSGALGRRTRFQQSDVSQLVLLAESRPRGESPPRESNSAIASKDAREPDGPSAGATKLPESLALNDDTLLEQTKFTSSQAADGSITSRLGHLDPAAQPALHPLDQCILLSLCLNVKNTSPAHGLTNEEMSAFVNRVIAHPANWSVHTMALLLRSRLEATRTRTVERSTLQLQALVDQMPTADSSVSERLLYIHDIPLPSRWELERELALQYISLGVTKSALAIFERLEMWEEVVKCWQSMERPDKGVAIVRDLLEGRKAEADVVLSRGKESTSHRRGFLDAAREAKLWCLLGDLEPANAINHYNRAWSISGEKSGRAMRSLGGYHFSRGEYARAISCLRRAVAINPLLHRSWFVLGCACIREEDWETARQAFSRCVAIDDEDGESWNNLASVYLRMEEAGQKPVANDEDAERDMGAPADEEKPAPSVPFSNKMLAFRALKQGIKYRYDDWRMWYNYMIVSMDVGELSEACRALGRIVEERAGKDGAKCVDEVVLERLVDAVTRDPTDVQAGATGGQDVAAAHAATSGLFRILMDLFERTILPRVSSFRIFRAYAKLLTWQSRWEEALKAYLDSYRCSTAGTIEKGETDVGKWREAVGEVEEIVDLLRNFGPRVDGSKWQLQARSIVRTFIGRTKDFEDEPEWERLTSLLEELRKED
ncbi:TPR-like protein [Gloeophyllum trabeum ATCC 11539]|uniref:TPR-like protein n=1 Tax=Gloeophyllum trabeum (strain ATCC 11539 / FP-39264 / Madison 617) TaxID=670483 RepID=S7QI35_GLOTA|nr:TPR-like protein [Gloeophyllum trabeum ATCC 11539]EPQ58888.1 TPR-like protein [Gloeophyllum trabeum ATCC 11539]